jgi:hypothetical protein
MLYLPNFMEVSHTVPHVLCLSPTNSLAGRYPVVALLGNKQVSISHRLGPYGLPLSSMSLPAYLQNCGLGLHTCPVSQTCFIHSHTPSKILLNYQGKLCQSMVFLTFLDLCTELLGHHGAYQGPPSLHCWDNSGPEWISSPRVLVAWYLGASPSREWASELLPGVELSWRSPRLLEIRSPKTIAVTIKDTGMESCFGKAKFTSAEHAQIYRHSKHKEQTIGPHSYFWCSGVLSPLLRLFEFRCTICLWLANTTLGIWG